MQKSLALAAIVGAVIIAAALVYHGRQLAQVSQRLEALEQRSNGLDNRLQTFSAQLPGVIEQAGHNAGRQAVHGMVEEAVQMPLSWLRGSKTTNSTALAVLTTNGLARLDGLPGLSELILDRTAPWVRFDIREPVVSIEILPNLKSMETMERDEEEVPATGTAAAKKL